MSSQDFLINFSFSFSRLPDDIWLVDLDSNKLTPPSGTAEEIPPLPEPEGTILKNHLKQVNGHFFDTILNPLRM